MKPVQSFCSHLSGRTQQFNASRLKFRNKCKLLKRIFFFLMDKYVFIRDPLSLGPVTTTMLHGTKCASGALA